MKEDTKKRDTKGEAETKEKKRNRAGKRNKNYKFFLLGNKKKGNMRRRSRE
jgi:hypothetical protein